MIKRRNLLLLLFLAASPLSSGVAAESQASKRIVILGDSITAGFGLDRSAAYPALLQSKVQAEGLHFEVVGAGVSGDTTAGGLRRVTWALGPGAAVCVVALGGNDGLRGVPPAQTEGNLERIIEAVRAKNPETVIILAGMQMPLNMGAEFREAFAAVFPRVAAKCKTLLIPFLLEGVGGKPEFNQEDLIHPNVEGQ
jgi:acyl-CoA thioesterase-1